MPDHSRASPDSNPSAKMLVSWDSRCTKSSESSTTGLMPLRTRSNSASAKLVEEPAATGSGCLLALVGYRPTERFSPLLVDGALLAGSLIAVALA